MAVGSLVLGIISLVFAVFGGIFGGSFVAAICGIIGIILGALGKKDPAKAGMATAGLVMSIIGTVLGCIVWIACAACLSSIGLF